jgi:uncharacterized protein involved in exopolysaccharide biosynthesis
MAGQNVESGQEITLRNYIEVVIKRKKLIFIVFFLSVITATAINLTTPKVYVATAVIQNGYIDSPIIKIAEAASIIESQAILETAY